MFKIGVSMPSSSDADAILEPFARFKRGYSSSIDLDRLTRLWIATLPRFAVGCVDIVS